MINFYDAPDVKLIIDNLIASQNLKVPTEGILCVRSKGTKSLYNNYFRIYPIRRIMQYVLNIPSYYIFEVISERFDTLSELEKREKINHVIKTNLPKKFSTVYRSRKGVINFFDDVEVKSRVARIVNALNWNHINTNRVFCLKSKGTKGRFVRARCWGLHRIAQLALKVEPCYIIEMMAEYYDKLSEENKDKIVIHELLHIPNGFKGGLRMHKGAHGDMVTASIVNKYYNEMRGNEGFSWI